MEASSLLEVTSSAVQVDYGVKLQLLLRRELTTCVCSSHEIQIKVIQWSRCLKSLCLADDMEEKEPVIRVLYSSCSPMRLGLNWRWEVTQAGCAYLMNQTRHRGIHFGLSASTTPTTILATPNNHSAKHLRALIVIYTENHAMLILKFDFKRLYQILTYILL